MERELSVGLVLRKLYTIFYSLFIRFRFQELAWSDERRKTVRDESDSIECLEPAFSSRLADTVDQVLFFVDGADLVNYLKGELV